MRPSAARTASWRRTTPENAAMGQTGMPDAIRTTVESFAHPQRGGFCAAAAVALGVVLASDSSHAAEGSGRVATFDAYMSALRSLEPHQIAALALILGVLCFAVVTAVLLLRTRTRLTEVEASARDEALASKAAIDRAYALLLSEQQVLVAWFAAADEPEIIGDPTLVTTADAPHRVLAFGTWLEPAAASAMERSVDALRARGVSFAMTLTTLAGQVLEAEGQVIGGRAILRLRQVSGIKYELAELAQQYQKQTDDAAALRALIDAVPAPVWARDGAGKLVFANQAYARAVEARDGTEAVDRGIELFDRNART